MSTIVTNQESTAIAAEEPYIVAVGIEGTAPILFHRWQNGSVAEKAAAAKNSKAKKTDNVESYVYRDVDRNICLPGVYLLGSMIDPKNGAAKYRQDPRSSRKSALDLFKAGVAPLTDLAPITPHGKTGPGAEWDFIDERRVTVQRAGITRARPGFAAGWSATVDLQVLTPEYISPADLHDCLNRAGVLVGVGDFRPMFGRFRIVRFEVISLS